MAFQFHSGVTPAIVSFNSYKNSELFPKLRMKVVAKKLNSANVIYGRPLIGFVCLKYKQ